MSTEQIIEHVKAMFPDMASKWPTTHAERVRKIARWCQIYLQLEGKLPCDGDIFWMQGLESVDEMEEVVQKWETHAREEKWCSLFPAAIKVLRPDECDRIWFRTLSVSEQEQEIRDLVGYIEREKDADLYEDLDFSDDDPY